MSSLGFAVAGTALALYYYSNSSTSGRRRGHGDDPMSLYDQNGTSFFGETHANAYRAPKSFFEDLYFFAEGLRYMYGETIYKWKTADLLFGLYYLCNSNKVRGDNHPLADVGQHGQVFGEGLHGEELRAAQEEIRLIEKCFRYNSCLRERRPIYRKRQMIEVMGVKEENFLKQAVSAGVLKPSYVLVKDEELKAIVLIIRGTHSVKDAFTSLTGASKPHHVVDSNGVTLGYSHFGMLAAARWMKGEVGADLEDALAKNPDCRPLIIGHSLGGGTAAMLTMMLREQGGLFENATCIAIACPACMTLELAESCTKYVTTVVNGCDVIPTMSSGAADLLREEVTNSSWYADFQQDMRSYRIYRALESGIRGVGSATSWTAVRLKSCYSRRSPAPTRNVGADTMIHHKRRNSEIGPGDDLVDDEAIGGSALGGLAQRRRRGETDAGHSEQGPSFQETPDQQREEGAPLRSSWFSRTLGPYWKMPGFMATYMPSSPSWGNSGGQTQDTRFNTDDHNDSSTCDIRDFAADDGGPDSLRAEASFRMRVVRDAVLDAEAEELEHDMNIQHKSRDDAVPSVIRPGAYGDSSPQKGSNHGWKRSMYPAGRIMHFVPATVVPGYDNFSMETDEEDDNDGFASTIHSRKVSELGMGDVLGGEEALGAIEPNHSQGPLPPLNPAPGPPPKNMILLDNVPQSLYGRIRPSPYILSDHVIPNYLRSLESFKKRFPV
jgi:pimeloyl-ACP methyl ester carboxylesterase